MEGRGLEEKGGAGQVLIAGQKSLQLRREARGSFDTAAIQRSWDICWRILRFAHFAHTFLCSLPIALPVAVDRDQQTKNGVVSAT